MERLQVAREKYRSKILGRRYFSIAIILFSVALSALIASIYFGVKWSYSIIGFGFGIAAFLSLIGIALIIPARKHFRKVRES